MTPKSFYTFLLGLATLALAATLPPTDYDVIIVGGGPAGLSALSGFSRVRRRAALFDSHEYRNGPTREMHDVIGNDGTPPAKFRALAREQISRYDTATFIDREILSIEQQQLADLEPNLTTTTTTTVFRATDATGASYTAARSPARILRKGHLLVPWCDGYEHRDQPLGILGTLPHIVSSVLEISTLNTDIIAFVNGSHTEPADAALTLQTPHWKAQLAASNARIENRTIAAIERVQDGGRVHDDRARDQQFDVFRVRFTEGEPVLRNAFLTNFETAQRSRIPAQLGLDMKDGKVDTSVYSGMRTSVPGVFAVGDCNSDGSTNVPHAMFSGKRAAVYGHVEMAREESAAAIAKRGLSRRAMEKETERIIGNELEDLWDRAKV
ncbi:hypothetical protein AOCH_001598 [Aspergillus ochraceoroseus]|uniref:FAD/NAD(P)-binding domain-containing protein n=1 Tax=Aspergillus ochraceoroseus TaxID=138278 RepID=A0A0F8U4H3_9EURO|nr:hypothetical protein AOCH_001598 [Aspergillus ochraceoroseus]